MSDTDLILKTNPDDRHQTTALCRLWKRAVLATHRFLERDHTDSLESEVGKALTQALQV